MLAFSCSAWLHKSFSTLDTFVVFHLQIDLALFDKCLSYIYYPIVSLHVNRQLLALCELFWAKGAMEVLDPKVNLFVRFQDVLVKKALATAFKRTFELSLCCVLHKVALQVVLVTAPASKICLIRNLYFLLSPLSTGWANNFFCATF